MPVELGESLHADGDTITLTSDGTGAAGDFVSFNATGELTPVAAADDGVIGVLAADSPAAGEDVAVHVQGVVVANVDGAVVAGDVLESDGVNAGRVAANAQGTSHQVDEGGTAIYRLSMDHPRALVDAGGTYRGRALAANEAAVKLP